MKSCQMPDTVPMSLTRMADFTLLHRKSWFSDFRFPLSGLVRQLLLVILFGNTVNLFAQLDAGPNDTINPGVPVTLTASYGLIGTAVYVEDDGVEGPFPIGFNFSFFGDIYTQFYIGANGWISFLPNQNAQGIRQAFAVPGSADYNPKACILGPFQDMDPEQAGNPFIYYKTIGQDSNRTLAVLWCQTPLYTCFDSLVTFQIILNEGSNSIENHIMSKPSCPDWYENKATLGVQNSNGYIGFAVPGRNATSWSANLEGWKYIPTSADSFHIAPITYHLQPITPGEKLVFRWYLNDEEISRDQSLVVSPEETTTYHVYATLCNNQEFHDSVTVVVIPYIPNAFTPNDDGLNDYFRILGIPPENITEFNLQIFNRWGQIVFTTQDIRDAWDGKIKDEPCPEGVYVWVIYYKDINKTKVSNKGTVMVVR